MMKIKAIVLDLDGTLLDTKPDLSKAHNFCLRALGFPERSMADFNHIVGGGIMNAIEKACPPGTPAEKLLEYNAMYQPYYTEHCAELTEHYEGMEAFLAACAEAGVLTAVFTNKTETTAAKIIRHYFPDTDFRFIWGNNGSRPLKPQADAGGEACRELGLLPEEIAYVGDSDTDMMFAKACGMLAVGACWGYRGREELKKAGADLLCEYPMEMSSLFKLTSGA